MSQTPACPDCGWRPEDELRTTAAGRREGLWPTEGPRGVWWMQNFVICGEGDWYGKKITLRDDQKLSVYRWYEWCGGCGHWRYTHWIRTEATGGGKTTFMGGIGVLELGGPPQIVPVSPNIVSAANSWDQANKLFGAASVMCGGQGRTVKESPLREFFEVYDSVIKRADGQPGKMVRVAAVAATNEGGLPSLFMCDEVHELGAPGEGRSRMHVVIGKSTNKRRLRCEIPREDGSVERVTRGSGRIIDISTAGFDVDNSFFGGLYLHGKRVEKDPGVDPRLLFECWEAPAGLDFARAEDRLGAVRAASPAAGVLWNPMDRVREWDNPLMPHHEWSRYYANRWENVAEDSWLVDHPAAWDQCRGSWALNGDEVTVLAVDMSLKHDSTAVVECALLGDGRTAVTARIWNPASGKIDHREVFAYIRERAHELGGRLAEVVYDPRFFELPARDLEEEDDLFLTEFDQWTIMAQAVGETFEQIIHGKIVHDGDAELHAEQEQVAVEDRRGGGDVYGDVAADAGHRR
jgi:phage terminase large subunit-like protein